MEWARLIYGQQFASSASPLLILHGLLGSSRNWQTMGAALAARLARPVITFDLPNHGKSARESLTWDLLTIQLSQEIDRAKEEPTLSKRRTTGVSTLPILMGHSLGGQIAMQALFRRPDLPISRLILVDIGPTPMYFAASPMNRYLEIMLEIEGLCLSSRKEAMNYFQQQLPTASETLLQFLFTNWGRRSAGASENNEGFLIPLDTLRKGMLLLSQTQKYPYAPLKLPTRLIRGGQSDYVTDADLPLIERCFSDYQIITIPQAGHWPHYETPTEFIGAISDAMQ